MLLFFDTETTGKCYFKLPPDHPSQPRLVQLGAVLYTDDGNQILELNCLVQPSGFEIPPQASAIHGITTEQAHQKGIPLVDAVNLFHSLPATHHVAHNYDYDRIIMAGESKRLGIPFPPILAYCTMKAMTPICNLPGLYGPKFPSLTEAYKHCFNETFEGAHDALADVKACARIYFWLMKQPHSPNSTRE